MLAGNTEAQTEELHGDDRWRELRRYCGKASPRMHYQNPNLQPKWEELMMNVFSHTFAFYYFKKRCDLPAKRWQHGMSKFPDILPLRRSSDGYSQLSFLSLSKNENRGHADSSKDWRFNSKANRGEGSFKSGANLTSEQAAERGSLVKAYARN
jgi:hypothetical protein